MSKFKGRGVGLKRGFLDSLSGQILGQNFHLPASENKLPGLHKILICFL